MEPRPIVCVIILLTGGLGHTQTCNPVEKQSRTGTQYELIILTWPVWRNLRDLKNFKNIWSRWRLFQDVWEKTETRTTMKGNCMSLDCKWLACTPRGGGREGRWGVEWCEDHPPICWSYISHWMSSSSNRSSKSEEGKTEKTEWIPLQLVDIFISNVSVSQASPHKAAFQVGGLEGGHGDKRKSASWWVCRVLLLHLWLFVRSEVSREPYEHAWE